MKKNFSEIDNVLLFGGGRLLLYFADKLIKESFTVTVFTSERHSKEIVSPSNKTLVDALAEKNIIVHVSNDVNTDKSVVSKITKNTLGFSISAAWIFNEDFIKRFSGKFLNIHGTTRLPHNRGGGGFSWHILAKNHLGLSVIHEIDPGVDTGDIVMYDEFIYPSSCIVPSDYEKILFENNTKLLDLFIRKIRSQEDFEITHQQEYFSSYWPRLSTEVHGYINWSWDLDQIQTFINAFDDPYRGASIFINGERVFVKECAVNFDDGTFHPLQKGIIYRKSRSALHVATEEGSLIIRKIFDEKGKNMYEHVQPGDRLYTPMRYLEEAALTRIYYTPQGLKKTK